MARQSDIDKLEALVKTLEDRDVRDMIVDSHIEGVRIHRLFSELELDTGISAIRSAIERQDDLRKVTPLGTIGIVAPYNTPSFALGYGGELVAAGSNIELYFSSDMAGYRRAVSEIIEKTGLENRIKVYMGSQKDFIPHVLSDLDGLQIYGGDAPFVYKFADDAQRICREKDKHFVYCFEGPGNDPAIVLQSARKLTKHDVPQPIDMFASALSLRVKNEEKDFWLKYVALNAVSGTIVGRGQSCMAFRRIIINQELYPELEGAIEKIVGHINRLPVSDEGQRSLIGPIGSESTNKKLFARAIGYYDGERYVPGQIHDAIQKGATVYLPDGSKTDDFDKIMESYVDREKGVMRPLVVAGVSPESRLNLEETFLPIISLVRSESDIASIDYATRGKYCLRTSLYGKADDLSFRNARNILSQHFGIVDENQPFFSAWEPSGEWGPGKANNRSGFVKVYSPTGLVKEILGPRKMYEVFSKEYITKNLQEE